MFDTLLNKFENTSVVSKNLIYLTFKDHALNQVVSCVEITELLYWNFNFIISRLQIRN